MLVSNPKIDGTQTHIMLLIDALPRQATSFNVTGTIAVPPWNGIASHYQGIAPYNGTTDMYSAWISASSTQGYFTGFSSVDNVTTVKKVMSPYERYYHAAGIQMLGDLLVVPFESDDASLKAFVGFYDVTNMTLVDSHNELYMPKRKASAAAITAYTDADGIEQALLMVYEYDKFEMYIYQTPVSALQTHNPNWIFIKTFGGDQLNTGDQFQSFALVTQTSTRGDSVYLLGFREDEELWLFYVDLTSGPAFGTPAREARFQNWSGSDWRNGMGLQIVSPTQIRLFGTAKDPSGSSTWPYGPANYNFNVYVYGT